jgi:hypothetical protein
MTPATQTLLWETRAVPEVTDDAFKRFLKLPPRKEFTGAVAEAAAEARAWYAQHGRPWGAAIATDSTRWTSACAELRAAPAAALIAVGAGTEVAEEAAARWTRDEPDRAYFLDRFAAAVTEALLAEAKRALGATFHDCPGFWDWPVTGNLDLLAAFNAAAPLPAPLEALDSGMLKPKTSQLALCDRPASAPLYVSR